MASSLLFLRCLHSLRIMPTMQPLSTAARIIRQAATHHEQLLVHPLFREIVSYNSVPLLNSLEHTRTTTAAQHVENPAGPLRHGL